MTERLWIMRHGQAAPGRPDPERMLTQRGHAEAARMAAWLTGREDLDLARLRLLTSPYVRARQTAAPIAEALGVPLEPLPILTPDDPPEAVVDWLLEQDDDRPLMLVSHMPLVASLTGLLVEGHPDRGPGFAPAAIAELTADVLAAGCARLVRLVAPSDIADQEPT